MIRSVIVAIKNIYKPLCKQESDNLWSRGKLYLSAFFVSAGVPNGEFPEILIAKCRSRFYCTWFFSRAEDFESWRKGTSKSGEKCSRWKVHTHENVIYIPLDSKALMQSIEGEGRNDKVFQGTCKQLFHKFIVCNRIFSFSHTFLITFKSGDCAGHSRQFIWFSSL
jgi:hypothetical protein